MTVRAVGDETAPAALTLPTIVRGGIRASTLERAAARARTPRPGASTPPKDRLMMQVSPMSQMTP